MIYNRGDIVWVAFPFTDGDTGKFRSALILSNRSVNATGDYILMQLTTRLRGDNLSLPLPESAFMEQPLRKPSELRLHKIFVLNQSIMREKITSLTDAYMKIIIEALHQLFTTD